LAAKEADSTAQELREEMRRLRSHMDADVDSFVENTRVLLDWHSYFESAPWLFLGAAALAGYLVVPAKAHHVTVDIEKLAELARHRQVVVTEHAEAKGAGSSLAKMALDLLWRTVLAVGTQQLNQFLSPRPDSPGPSPAPGTAGPSRGR
jgi:hypothetical protein